MILAATMHPEAAITADDAIVRLRRGDLDALAVVLPQYQVRLYRFLLRMVRDPAAAEDLFQQTWLRVIEKISGYNPRYRFDSWLYSVAHNLAIDHVRRQRGWSLDAAEEGEDAPVARLASYDSDPLERVLETERGAILSKALDKLPAIHRAVLTLRFEEEMKLEEIAAVVDIPLSTVKSRLRRALDGLRRNLHGQLAPGGSK
jgi:RNA polymerase sigma-70 factor (ECF subfamily)